MTILDRLSRLLRANVNDLISRAEDPGMIIDQALRDMRGAYAEARNEVAGAMAQNAKMEREANTNRTLASEYEKKAEEALRGGSEDLAREALRRAQNHKDLAKGFDEQRATQQSTVDQLRRSCAPWKPRSTRWSPRSRCSRPVRAPRRLGPRWTA